MSQIISSALLANGLRTEFADTYTKIRNRQADGRIGMVMDLGVKATNRRHEFGYLNAAPHVELWKRGDSIPEDAMDSVQFTGTVHNWGRRVKWHKNDRKDEQTGTLLDAARGAGESAALLPERMFFDLLAGTTNTLPAVPIAPDGAAFFATTASSVNRFGVSSGNLLTGTGIASSSTILADYYNAIEQFLLFQDGKGQPLLSPEMIAQGVIVIHAAADTEAMETAFLQKRQGIVKGTDAGTTPSNIVQDSSRDVMLMGSPRLSTGDWYVFLKNPPKKPTFLLDREGLLEQTSLEGDSNGDLTRTTGIEYIQWELRQGAGIALPYGAVKINN
ncbi:MAG: hypothetical protein RIS45_1787 [Planctomycetota bacterium]